MTKYGVYPRLYATGNPIIVTAKSKKEAIEKAEEKYEAPGLCWSCANEMDLGDHVEFDEKDVEVIK